MAKLNKMEISAIAESIYDKINDGINERNELLTSEEAYTSWLEEFENTREYDIIEKTLRLIELFNTTFKEYKERYSYRLEISINEKDDILKAAFQHVTKLEVTKATQLDIERELIIAQARNEDIDAMIINITEKYS